MAAFSLFRFARFLRSIFVPTASIIGFSFLLTYIFILYQPTPGPGSIQRVGWQSWEIITEGSVGGQDTAGSLETTSGSNTDSTNPTVPHGADWWNVSTTTETTDSASLPLDTWDPMMQHDTGLSEIHITECLFDPWYVPISADVCYPSTTKQDDAHKGKWVRVGPNLKQEVSLKSLNVYYRRTRRHDIPLVTELSILPENQTPPAGSTGWLRVDHPINPKGAKRYLWYKAAKAWKDMSEGERKNDVVTEIDVLFGSDTTWYGFEKVDQATFDGDGKTEPVWLTHRKGVHSPPRAPPLHFSHDGKFKIMQVADLHYSVSLGSCRDTPDPCTGSDNLTNTLLGKMLDAEKPDFIVFTGDQLNGQTTAWDGRSILAKFAKAVTERGIPWAAVFGNHDEEDGMLKEHQIHYMKGLPYSMVERGPKDVHGVGNYVLKVKSADPSATHLLTMYFLDSGSYSAGFMDWFGLHPTAYDYLRQDQIDWFLQESASIDTVERPFMPDGAKDLGHLWKRQGQVMPGSGRRLAKPNALMFFHIPLQESYSAADINPETGRPLDVGISDMEASGAAKKQEGFFHKALLEAFESDHRTSRAPEVKVVANGHCHLTENCRRVKGVWLCFGGGGSYSGYGKAGFDRRFRVYDVSDFGETIRTYKRTEHDEIVDDMILAGRGAPPV
ncbi:Metallo-dependent phosphatase [Epithele typhae]|uniref:Metallo-dependent phosphatase n=1 Tax=Epithele typhae TaxID=378194 RepID=UPI002008CC53|nr:Metallo-dependent phosphatase [Epithele typhae]KAH9926297.1 Metallo-dependent phosphatase [Epithele typhae]